MVHDTLLSKGDKGISYVILSLRCGEIISAAFPKMSNKHMNNVHSRSWTIVNMGEREI